MFFKRKYALWYPMAAIVLLAVWYIFPRDVFVSVTLEKPPVLVVDAGHGGADGGAVAPNGTQESTINLAIALRLEALADFWGITTVMTRTAENIQYPEDAVSIAQMKRADQNARLELINDTPGAVLISIHQNCYPSEAPNGIQVFYGYTDPSRNFAEITQNNLTEFLCPNNRRVEAEIDSGIYLMRNARCDAILVECGFISNPNELSQLTTDDYQTKLAAVMLASYLQYTKGAIT